MSLSFPCAKRSSCSSENWGKCSKKHFWNNKVYTTPYHPIKSAQMCNMSSRCYRVGRSSVYSNVVYTPLETQGTADCLYHSNHLRCERLLLFIVQLVADDIANGRCSTVWAYQTKKWGRSPDSRTDNLQQMKLISCKCAWTSRLWIISQVLMSLCRHVSAVITLFDAVGITVYSYQNQSQKSTTE